MSLGIFIIPLNDRFRAFNLNDWAFIVKKLMRFPVGLIQQVTAKSTSEKLWGHWLTLLLLTICHLFATEEACFYRYTGGEGGDCFRPQMCSSLIITLPHSVLFWHRGAGQPLHLRLPFKSASFFRMYVRMDSVSCLGFVFYFEVSPYLVSLGPCEFIAFGPFLVLVKLNLHQNPT